MNPGDLRNQITIQQKATPVTRDAAGQETPTWSTVATVWASIEPLRGQEFLEAARLQAQVDHRIRIRYRAGLSPAMRVVFGSRIFNITAVVHVKERRREIQLMCKELING